jgi:hypothetical protein
MGKLRGHNARFDGSFSFPSKRSFPLLARGDCQIKSKLSHYIRPFSESFRFSLCVPALALILLYLAAPPLVYATIAGAVMLFWRGIIAVTASDGMTLAEYCIHNAPVMAFYVTFGSLFSLLPIQKYSERSLRLFFSLLVCEISANVAKLFMRNLFTPQPLEQGVFFVMLVGITRSGATAAVYRLNIYWRERHECA